MSGILMVVVFAVVAAVVHVVMTLIYEAWFTDTPLNRIWSKTSPSYSQSALFRCSVEESPLPNETIVVGPMAKTDEGETLDPMSENTKNDLVSAVDKKDEASEDDSCGFMWQASDESVKGWSAPCKEAAGRGQILTCHRVLPMQIRCSSSPGMDTTGALRPKLATPPVMSDPIPWHDTDRRLISIAE
eukprot:6211993-Pleurochrysis_carterae.AAC.2